MEFMLTLIFFLFVAGLLFSLLLPWLIRGWLKRVQRRFGMDGGAAFGNEPQNGAKERIIKRKKIDPSEGDYIDFEEIK